ncbi:biofilm PGA synthesis lipoprotein PgaB [Paenibacillus sophorae]|uniref:Biofilm PGA synthesis lipoprotein PgaB n=1 Tax=Paenibacillus sophorae TaxID=1333845 RepID=A0A1H8L0X7_9BACL|nr:polysaccharide deacetylase family protein [Paenibacillus sophorae]QWU17475.1 polysaccharide deacetylase family protein [Paenibacillus sophorae]SEN98822.1 biofilm PGA synthesis lipoprotein PgaB [Paenibacillus sophorae]
MRKIIVPVLAAAILASLAGFFGFRQESHEVDFEVGGRVLKSSGPLEYSHHELLVPQTFAESLLGVNIRWDRPAPLPKGVYYKNKVAVLMYHHLSRKPLLPSILSVNRFGDQMKLLKQDGYHVITMEQYRRFMLEDGKIPDNAVLLTFDDGYESFYKLAFPILRKYSYTAVDFVIVSDVDNPGKGGLPKLTWQQMREMKKIGMGFYNHTYNLHFYDVVDAEGGKEPALTAQLYINDENRNEYNEEYYRRVKGDLGLAERRLKEELGNTDSALAFPYGAYNDKVLHVTASLGIPLTFTVKEGLTDRGERNAGRINGGSNLRTPAQTIDRIRQFVPKRELTVNGRSVFLAGVQPEFKNGRLLVPLDDICRSLHIAMDYDRYNGTVKLTLPGGHHA